MRRGRAVAAGFALAGLLISGCSTSARTVPPTRSTSGGTGSTSPTLATQSTTGSVASGQPVAVGRSVVLAAPGGTKVRVTLVSYLPSVAESTGDSLTPHVLGVNLRLTNLSNKIVAAHPPDYYAVLNWANTAGASTVPHASGPCGGRFYVSPIHLLPHRSSAGCIPYSYGDAPGLRPVRFGFGFGMRLAYWPVSAG